MPRNSPLKPLDMDMPIDQRKQPLAPLDPAILTEQPQNFPTQPHQQSQPLSILLKEDQAIEGGDH
jgi:hypothetical protein